MITKIQKDWLTHCELLTKNAVYIRDTKGDLCHLNDAATRSSAAKKIKRAYLKLLDQANQQEDLEFVSVRRKTYSGGLADFLPC